MAVDPCVFLTEMTHLQWETHELEPNFTCWCTKSKSHSFGGFQLGYYIEHRDNVFNALVRVVNREGGMWLSRVNDEPMDSLLDAVRCFGGIIEYFDNLAVPLA
jgi:hypothetical protein